MLKRDQRKTPEIKFLSTKEKAQRLHTSVTSIKRLIASKKIKAIKRGRDWLIADNKVAFHLFFTVKTLAQAIKFSMSHIRYLIRKGEIKAIKIGRDWVITDIEQKSYIRQRRPPFKRTHKRSKKLNVRVK